MIKELFLKYWHVIIPIIISIVSAIYSNIVARQISNKSMLLAREANELSKKSIVENEKQFLEEKRPQLIAEMLSIGTEKSNFLLYGVRNKNTIKIEIMVLIKNVGALTAKSVLIEDALIMLAYKGEIFSSGRTYYDFQGHAYSKKEDVWNNKIHRSFY